MFKFILALAVLGVTFGAPRQQIKTSSNLRIIGGKDADIKDHPWQVSLQLFGQHYCGGALISDKWVVSAAVCIYQNYFESFLTVRVGSTDFEIGGQSVSVARYIIHPNYPFNETFNNNIALLELASPVNFSTSVKAASLPEAGQDIPDDSQVTMAGWGAIESTFGVVHSILQSVTIPTVNQTACQAAYSDKLVTDQMFCAGLFETGGKDSCKGDLGNPAEIDKQVVGITSWGIGCGAPRQPTIFIKISLFRDWIYQNTGI